MPAVTFPALRLVPINTAWWQRPIGVNKLPKVIASAVPGWESNLWSLVASPTHYSDCATMQYNRYVKVWNYVLFQCIVSRWLSWMQRCSVEHIHIHCANKHKDVAAGPWSQVGSIHCQWVCFCRRARHSVILAAGWDTSWNNIKCSWSSAPSWSARNTPHGLYWQQSFGHCQLNSN